MLDTLNFRDTDGADVIEAVEVTGNSEALGVTAGLVRDGVMYTKQESTGGGEADAETAAEELERRDVPGGVSVTVPDAVADTAALCVEVASAVLVVDIDKDAVAGAVKVGITLDAPAVRLELGVAVCEELAVPVRLELGVSVIEELAVPVRLELGVCVCEELAVPVEVIDDVAVFEILGAAVFVLEAEEV